jgi:MFS family permease
MVEAISRVTTLLFAVTILLAGHGLQLTLLPVHALALGWSGSQIGITGSFYFVGFVAGCVLIPGVVSRVGHIRSFMVMAAAATVALLAVSVLPSVWAWMLLRFVTGLALAGLYMIVESWLADVTPAEKRGTVLSIYLAVSLVGMAAGQLPMMFSMPGDIRLFVLAAILLSLAIIPIGLTRVASPRPIPQVRVTPRTLIRASRVAVVCALIMGMVTGSFWTLGPVVPRELGLAPGYVGLMMSFGVLGGAAFQYPIGILSDRTDRRFVIAMVTACGAIIAAVGTALADSSTLILLVATAFLCAATMPVYGLCIALAAEKTELTLVEITSGILLTNGIGSILGPLIAAPAMAVAGPEMFFGFCAGCLATASCWTFYRYFFVERHGGAEAHRPMLPRTTQAVAGLLVTEARSDDDEKSD